MSSNDGEIIKVKKKKIKHKTPHSSDNCIHGSPGISKKSNKHNKSRQVVEDDTKVNKDDEVIKPDSNKDSAFPINLNDTLNNKNDSFIDNIEKVNTTFERHGNILNLQISFVLKTDETSVKATKEFLSNNLQITSDGANRATEEHGSETRKEKRKPVEIIEICNSAEEEGQEKNSKTKLVKKKRKKKFNEDEEASKLKQAEDGRNEAVEVIEQVLSSKRSRKSVLKDEDVKHANQVSTLGDEEKKVKRHKKKIKLIEENSHVVIDEEVQDNQLKTKKKKKATNESIIEICLDSHNDKAGEQKDCDKMQRKTKKSKRKLAEIIVIDEPESNTSERTKKKDKKQKSTSKVDEIVSVVDVQKRNETDSIPTKKKKKATDKRTKEQPKTINVQEKKTKEKPNRRSDPLVETLIDEEKRLLYAAASTRKKRHENGEKRTKKRKKKRRRSGDESVVYEISDSSTDVESVRSFTFVVTKPETNVDEKPVVSANETSMDRQEEVVEDRGLIVQPAAVNVKLEMSNVNPVSSTPPAIQQPIDNINNDFDSSVNIKLENQTQQQRNDIVTNAKKVRVVNNEQCIESAKKTTGVKINLRDLSELMEPQPAAVEDAVLFTGVPSVDGLNPRTSETAYVPVQPVHMFFDPHIPPPNIVPLQISNGGNVGVVNSKREPVDGEVNGHPDSSGQNGQTKPDETEDPDADYTQEEREKVWANIALTADEKYILKHLTIKIAFEVPLLHGLETVFAESPSEELTQIRALNLNIDDGPFAEWEDQIIVANFKYFCKRNKIPEKSVRPFTIKEYFKLFPRDVRANFVKCVGRNLKTRTLYRIYERFCYLLTKTDTKFESDDEILVNYMEYVPDVEVGLNVMADVFHKNYTEVRNHFNKLKRNKLAYKKLLFTHDYIRKIIDCLVNLTFSRNVYDLRRKSITNKIWLQASERFKKPPKTLQFFWEKTIYPKLFFDKNVNDCCFQEQLIHYFTENRLYTWDSVNWTHIQQTFEGCDSQKLQRILLDLFSYYVPNNLQNDFQGSLLYMRKYVYTQRSIAHILFRRI